MPTMTRLEVSIPFSGSRYLPPQAAGQFAQALEASGVVDHFQAWDQLTSWYPQALWRPEIAPAAAMIGDCDAFQDAFVSAAFAAAMTTDLGVAVSTDALRRGPAEILQTMLTLSDGVGRPAICMLGAGELKQALPFGYRRAEGLDRLEDTLRIMTLLLDKPGLVDHDGHQWKYQGAWIGGAKPHRPRFLAMGGGPRLMQIAAELADGFVTIAPFAFASPEQYAEAVTSVRRDLERRGRDPEAFTFGLWHAALITEDGEDVDRLLDNPLLRFFAAMAGRLDQKAWAAEGVEAVFPDDWHYALKLLPAALSDAEVESVVARTSRRMVERSYTIGSPKEVAETMAAYTDAGATYHSVCDMAPFVRPLETAASALAAQIESCRLLKAAAA
jgi:phthiodiolone/phenolphthiodiolone dimycocerosates ketoreductase